MSLPFPSFNQALLRSSSYLTERNHGVPYLTTSSRTKFPTSRFRWGGTPSASSEIAFSHGYETTGSSIDPHCPGPSEPGCQCIYMFRLPTEARNARGKGTISKEKRSKGGMPPGISAKWGYRQNAPAERAPTCPSFTFNYDAFGEVCTAYAKHAQVVFFLPRCGERYRGAQGVKMIPSFDTRLERYAPATSLNSCSTPLWPYVSPT